MSLNYLSLRPCADIFGIIEVMKITIILKRMIKTIKTYLHLRIYAALQRIYYEVSLLLIVSENMNRFTPVNWFQRVVLTGILNSSLCVKIMRMVQKSVYKKVVNSGDYRQTKKITSKRDVAPAETIKHL